MIIYIVLCVRSRVHTKLCEKLVKGTDLLSLHRETLAHQDDVYRHLDTERRGERGGKRREKDEEGRGRGGREEKREREISAGIA